MSLDLTSPSSRRRSPHASWFAVGAALAALGMIAPAVRGAFALGDLYIYKVLTVFLAAGSLVAWLAQKHLAADGFGVANQVTLARAAALTLLVGLLGETPAPELGWFVAGATLVILILDGVDGRLARARGTTSAFGARFDMETDALLALVLALLVLHFDKAGAIVLLAGLMRYAFAAAAALVPRLRRPLPPSRRRQALCVAELAGLGLCLVPRLARPVSDWLALAVVGAVAASFAIDLHWLARRNAAPVG